MRLLRRSSSVPLWRDEFTVDTAAERYVTRRQFSKFLVLTSLGMFVGNLWILARSVFRKAPVFPEKTVLRKGEIVTGGVRLFSYPESQDPCILVRTGEDTYVAYSQKCTHLSCAVYFDALKERLECPCHEGMFSVRDGRVLQGPPPRPLPRILLERRGDEIVAVGVALGAEA